MTISIDRQATDESEKPIVWRWSRCYCLISTLSSAGCGRAIISCLIRISDSMPARHVLVYRAARRTVSWVCGLVEEMIEQQDEYPILVLCLPLHSSRAQECDTIGDRFAQCLDGLQSPLIFYLFLLPSIRTPCCYLPTTVDIFSKKTRKRCQFLSI